MTDQHDPFDRGYEKGFNDAVAHLSQKDKQPGDGQKPVRTLADVGKLTPEEVNSRWAEVQAVMGAKR